MVCAHSWKHMNSPQFPTQCYWLVLFPISFHCVCISLYWCTDGISVCYYLHRRIFNLESKYSTPQLLTSDSRYSLLVSYSIYTKLLTLDSSCLISCHSCMQPSQSVLLCSTDLPYNAHSPRSIHALSLQSLFSTPKIYCFFKFLFIPMILIGTFRLS